MNLSQPVCSFSFFSFFQVHDPLGPIIFNKPNVSHEDIVLGRAVLEDWTRRIRVENYPVFMLVSRTVDDNTMLLYILTILHNLSFEIANEQFLAFSVTIMRHLVSLIHIAAPSGLNSPLTEASRLAYSILGQVSKSVDVPCRRRVQCDLWLEDPIGIF
jgi:hypothetical protein